MKKRGLFSCVFFFLLLSGSISFAASGWISFSSSQLTAGRPGDAFAYPEVDLLTSNANEVILEVNFPGMVAKDVVKEGMTYQTLFMPGGGKTHNLGWAELPTFGRFIAVPLEAEAQIEVLEYTARTLSGYNVYPVQEQPVDKAGAPEPEFIKDEGFYQQNEFYPDRMVFAEEPKIIRGCPVSLFVLFPVKYNPAAEELKVCSYMKVRISFVGGRGDFIDPARRSPYFEPLYQNLLLNYSSLGTPPQLGGKSDTGCDYLIITHPNFQAWAESLALWKNLSGISTWVKNTSETGSDTGSIRSYIESAYDTWTPPPSFVLLIGDAEFIPVFYRTTHPYDGYKIGTDLYYFTVDGYDWFPDIFMGRISVDTPEQVEAVMNKVLNYQTKPIATPTSFYNNVLAAAYFQDRPPYQDGYADRFFLQTSEVVRDFLLSQGYDVERCYTKTEGSDPQYYYFGEPLPPGLTWDGDSIQINNAINNGVFLVNHRDHGGDVGWGDPAYYVDNVNSLANQDRLPIVFSINCETGHFDNETDDPGFETPVDSLYFCEAFQRKVDGGAVGIFGHTRVSYSGYNDELCKGLYDGIWTNFDPSYPNMGSTNPISNTLFRMGALLDFGKFWMYDKYYLTNGAGYPWPAYLSTTKLTFEMFHYFGDPTTEIWTSLPETLNVAHSDTIFSGPSVVSLTATSMGAPVESVLVCLMNDETYERDYTNAEGEVTLSCSTTIEGDLYITATKHNNRPYQGLVTIVEFPFIHGDANGDSLIDIADVVFLINYLFLNGPPPYPLDAGNCNCDGVIDIADVVYLINYLFIDGPVPSCP
jgi:hypothetical protein